METDKHKGCRLALLWDGQDVKNMDGCCDITAKWDISLLPKVPEYSSEKMAPDALNSPDKKDNAI